MTKKKTRRAHPILQAYGKAGSYRKLAEALRPGEDHTHLYDLVSRARKSPEYPVPAELVRPLAAYLGIGAAEIRPDLYG